MGNLQFFLFSASLFALLFDKSWHEGEVNLVPTCFFLLFLTSELFPWTPSSVRQRRKNIATLRFFCLLFVLRIDHFIPSETTFSSLQSAIFMQARALWCQYTISIVKYSNLLLHAFQILESSLFFSVYFFLVLKKWDSFPFNRTSWVTSKLLYCKFQLWYEEKTFQAATKILGRFNFSLS